MTSEKITIHSMQTSSGQRIDYARIIRKTGSIVIGQTVMLYRLSAEQLRHLGQSRSAR